MATNYLNEKKKKKKKKKKQKKNKKKKKKKKKQHQILKAAFATLFSSLVNRLARSKWFQVVSSQIINICFRNGEKIPTTRFSVPASLLDKSVRKEENILNTFHTEYFHQYSVRPLPHRSGARSRSVSECRLAS